MRIPVLLYGSILASFLSGSVIHVSAATLPADGVRTTAGVNFRGTIVPNLVDSKPHPGSAFSEVSAGPGTPFSFFNEPVAIAEAARAIARASSLPGDLGAYSLAGGGFGTDTESITAAAQARQITYWQAKTSDPATITSDIDITANYHGALFISEGGAAHVMPSFAQVVASITMTSSIETKVVFNMNALLFETAGLLANGSALWSSSFVEKTVAPSTFGERYFELGYTEFFPGKFSVPVNQDFALDSQLFAQGSTPNSFEAWAIADFLSSGSFELQTSTPGVTLVAVSAPIPWPAPIWLWLAGGACLALRRRSR